MTLMHEPSGNAHPYAQEAWERFPREPCAGEVVTIGILVTEAPRDTRVSLAATTREGQELHVRGELSHSTTQGLVYRASLPGFPEAQRVTYTVYAESAEEHVSAGPFSFFITRRCSVTRILGSGMSGDVLMVDVATSWPGHNVRFAFSLSTQGTLQIVPSLLTAEETAAAARARPLSMRLGDFSVTSQADSALFSIRGARGLELLRETQPFSFLVDESSQVLAMRQTFHCAEGEAFFGFGERFDGLNQRGRIIDNRVYDNYTRQGMKTYIPLPSFLSSRGYGHFIDTFGPVVYRMDSEADGTWSYEAVTRGRMPVVHVLRGTPRSIVRGFRALTGKATVPPSWAFGPWMSGNEWNSQKRVMEVADRSRGLGIPVAVLVIEAWSDEATFSIWNDARYAPRDPATPFTLSDFTFPAEGLWPDPKFMIDELHDRGIKVLLWQIPVLKKHSDLHPQHERDQAFAREKGWCVKNADGSPYIVRPPWFRGAMVLDFTNPDAERWWFDRRRYLVKEMGVDGFKTDGGEHLWGDGISFHKGPSGTETWNAFVTGYLAGYRRFLEETRGNNAITFSRAGYLGAQQFPLHWNGDQDSSWESHASTLFATLNAGLSGLPFIGWDIGGFAGVIPSAELYLRSAAMALFSPLMQYHSDFNNHKEPCIDRTPWNIAEQTGVAKVVDIYRRFARARIAMLPYLMEEAQFCVDKGDPLMQPLFLEWPEQPAAWACTDQYLLGRSLLVAPVLEPGKGSREIFLPPGEWECLFSGRRIKGGRRVQWPAPVESIPVFLRAGASFPLKEVREALNA